MPMPWSSWSGPQRCVLELELIRDQGELPTRGGEAERLCQQLHAAMLRSDWTETLVLAGRLLELSPQSTMAADARRRAWLAVGVRSGENKPLDATE
jgi:hypothetical protein